MPDLVHSTVRARTALPERWLRHASHQAMSALLTDWEKAHRRLGSRIVALRSARDSRQADTEAGRWPPPNRGT